MIALQSLGKLEDSGQYPRHFAMLGVQRSEWFVRDAGFRFSVMVAHQACNDVLRPPAESLNLPVAYQIFAMAMMSFSVHQMAGIMQRRCCFEDRPQFEVHAVIGPKLVK